MFHLNKKILPKKLIYLENDTKKINYTKNLANKLFQKQICKKKFGEFIKIKKNSKKIPRTSIHFSKKITKFYIILLNFFKIPFYHFTNQKKTSFSKDFFTNKFKEKNFYLEAERLFIFSPILSRKRLSFVKKSFPILLSSFRKFKVLQFYYSSHFRKYFPNYKNQFFVKKNFFSEKENFKKKNFFDYIDIFKENKLKNENSGLFQKRSKLNNFSEFNQFKKNIFYIFQKSNHFLKKGLNKKIDIGEFENNIGFIATLESWNSKMNWMPKNSLNKNRRNQKKKKKNKYF